MNKYKAYVCMFEYILKFSKDLIIPLKFKRSFSITSYEAFHFKLNIETKTTWNISK